MGAAGAIGAVSSGVLLTPVNPAAIALRVPWSQTWFDWELDAGITFPSSVTGLDFDNNGDDGYSNRTALFFTLGGGIQLGHLGFGLTLDYQEYDLESRSESGIGVDARVIRVLVPVAYSWLEGELTTGIALGINSIDLVRADEVEAPISSVTGPSLHAGAVWAPAYAPLRVGLATRLSLPASAQPDARPACNPPQCVQAGDDFISDGFFLPRTVSLPNEVRLGFAYQFFKPLNFAWTNPKTDRPLRDQAVRRIERQRKERMATRERALAEASAAGGDIEAVRRRHDAIDRKARAEEHQQLDEAVDDDLERREAVYESLPRPRLLVALNLTATLATTDGVGLESFLEQTVERSGERLTIQPHAAAETEAWPGYVTVRAGTYLEPTRFRAGSDRWHGTGGLDIHIPLAWSIFGLLDDDTTYKLTGAIDGSQRYLGWNVGVGLWH
ncbi:MAG: hypothetical protein AAF928_05705 [Myxococcota bacterium]